MEFDIRGGMQHTSTIVVEEKDTAKHYGSGTLDVLATPAMIALMENAAMLAVAQHLPEALDTVGIEIEVEHSNPSDIGATVNATAVLTKIKGRRLFFLLKANDETGEIGRGTHVRYIIDKNKFMNKLKR
jgi:predicted thioesterase